MKKCERCGKKPESGIGLLDYCAICGKDLCDECMRLGCCNETPARSGMSDDHVDE